MKTIAEAGPMVTETTPLVLPPLEVYGTVKDAAPTAAPAVMVNEQVSLARTTEVRLDETLLASAQVMS